MPDPALRPVCRTEVIAVSFTFHRPRSFQEVLDLLEGLGEGTVLLAGGTDLLVQMERQIIAPKHVVSLQDVAGLNQISTDSRGLHLGAMVTHRELEKSPRFRGSLAGLSEACATVGGVQVRNLGTVGGNLVNASPAADTPPALLCLDATVTAVGRSGERELPLDRFFPGYRRTALRPGEVLTAIHIPPVEPRTGTAFFKLGRRRAMEISVACSAARLTLAEDGRTIREARIALGAVAPTAIRSREAESMLSGRQADEKLFHEAGRAAGAEAQPIDDLRASADYRRKVTAVLVSRALTACLERVRGQ